MTRVDPVSELQADTIRPGRVTFQSGVSPTEVVTNIAGNVALPDVVISAGAILGTISRVYTAISYRKSVESSGAANAVNVAQTIQVRKAASTFIDAIVIPDNSLAHAASATEGGAVIAGDIDISGEVDGPATYNVQWTAADVDGASLTFHDLQVFLIVEFS